MNEQDTMTLITRLAHRHANALVDKPSATDIANALREAYEAGYNVGKTEIAAVNMPIVLAESYRALWGWQRFDTVEQARTTLCMHVPPARGWPSPLLEQVAKILHEGRRH